MCQKHSAADGSGDDPEFILQGQPHTIGRIFGTAGSSKSQAFHAGERGLQTGSFSAKKRAGVQPSRGLLADFANGVEVAQPALLVRSSAEKLSHNGLTFG